MEDFLLRLSIQLPGFLLAIVAHEAAHALMAHWHGDDTAKRMGRLTLNPVAHMDIFGTLIFPLILTVMPGSMMFGWAKPVPIDPRHFKNIRKGIFWVSFAGPLANIILGIFSAFLFALVVVQLPEENYFYQPVVQILRQSVVINIVLAVFNLIPFPPLDGSKMVSTFLDYNMGRKYEDLQRYSMLFFLFLMFTGVLNYVISPALMAGSELISFFLQLLG
jgi:Zn-dependent protease